MEIITLAQEKIQNINVTLGKQNCNIRLYQMPSGLYLDLMVDNKAIVLGVPCLPFTKIVRYSYLGFEGDLFFVDYGVTDGTIPPEEITELGIDSAMPNYKELGTRYQLYYLAPSD